jgi:hypothetical protein
MPTFYYVTLYAQHDDICRVKALTPEAAREQARLWMSLLFPLNCWTEDDVDHTDTNYVSVDTPIGVSVYSVIVAPALPRPLI